MFLTSDGFWVPLGHPGARLPLATLELRRNQHVGNQDYALLLHTHEVYLLLKFLACLRVERVPMPMLIHIKLAKVQQSLGFTLYYQALAVFF